MSDAATSGRGVPHAGGPWEADLNPTHGRVTVYAPDEFPIPVCEVCDTVYEQANANLIAAAPELLEALEDARKAIAEHIGPERTARSERIARYDAAIRKARGG